MRALGRNGERHYVVQPSYQDATAIFTQSYMQGDVRRV